MGLWLWTPQRHLNHHVEALWVPVKLLSQHCSFRLLRRLSCLLLLQQLAISLEEKLLFVGEKKSKIQLYDLTQRRLWALEGGSGSGSVYNVHSVVGQSHTSLPEASPPCPL